VSNHGVPSPLRPASQVAQPPFYRRQRHGVCCRIHRPSDTASKAAAAVGSRAPKIRTICHSCKETYGTDELDANRLASGKRVLGRDAAAADVLTRSQLSARVRMAGWRDADLKRDVPSRSFLRCPLRSFKRSAQFSSSGSSMAASSAINPCSMYGIRGGALFQSNPISSLESPYEALTKSETRRSRCAIDERDC
jgi:hypothetical protein